MTVEVKHGDDHDDVGLDGEEQGEWVRPQQCPAHVAVHRGELKRRLLDPLRDALDLRQETCDLDLRAPVRTTGPRSAHRERPPD
jgi:hypothetical protein